MSSSPFPVSAEKEWEPKWEMWAIDPSQLAEFQELFRDIDVRREGFITGEQAKLVFSSSGLPKDVLGKIWSLADRNQDLKLDEKEYAIAMYLIRQKQTGALLPSSLPKNLVYSVYPQERPSSAPTSGTTTPKSRTSSSGGLTPASPIADYKTIPQVFGNNVDLNSSLSLEQLKAQIEQDEEDEDQDNNYGTMPSVPGVPVPNKNAYGEMPSIDLASSVRDILVSSAKGRTTTNSNVPTPYGAINSPSSVRNSKLLETPPIHREHSRSSSFGSTKSDSPGSSSDMIPPPPPSQRKPAWREYMNKDGRYYYHNKELGITQWEQPTEEYLAHKSKLRASVGSPSTASHRNSLVPTSSSGEFSTNMMENTSTVMHDPEKVEFFRKFLEAEGTNRDMLFLMDVETFSKSVKNKSVLQREDIEYCHTIYAKYIVKEAPYPVDLPPKIKKTIKDKVKEFQKKGTPPPKDIFDEAHEEVVKRLNSDQFPKFLKSMFYITMYNSILSRSPYELPEEIWKEFRTAAEGSVEAGWEYITENKGVLIHKKKYSGWTGTCVRGSGLIQVSPQDMLVIATNPTIRTMWDHHKFARIVEKFDTKTVIMHYEFKPPKIVAFANSHDFLVLRTERVESDGTILILSRSVYHQDVPERKGITRSEIDIAGFCVKPAGNAQCTVIYVNQTELKGLPKMIEDVMVGKRALAVYNIRKFVEKELKDSAKQKRQPIWKNPPPVVVDNRKM